MLECYKFKRVCAGIYRIGDIKVCNRRKEDDKDWWCVITSDPFITPEVTHSRHRLLKDARKAAQRYILEQKNQATKDNKKKVDLTTKEGIVSDLEHRFDYLSTSLAFNTDEWWGRKLERMVMTTGEILVDVKSGKLHHSMVI